MDDPENSASLAHGKYSINSSYYYQLFLTHSTYIIIDLKIYKGTASLGQLSTSEDR
jgi:hypothetical protein